MKFRDLANKMYQDGYKDGYPSVEAATIDASVAREATCENCGHEGLAYRPFVTKGSYRAVAYCSECKEAFEF